MVDDALVMDACAQVKDLMDAREVTMFEFPTPVLDFDRTCHCCQNDDDVCEACTCGQCLHMFDVVVMVYTPTDDDWSQIPPFLDLEGVRVGLDCVRLDQN